MGTQTFYDSLHKEFKETFTSRQPEIIPIWDFFEACKDDRSLYASPHERLLKAIGEPELIETSKDDRLSRIFQNRTIRRYEAFSDFHGMEDVIENMVQFLTKASQGLEEARQILYLLGPVGGGKSSLANKLKTLLELEPIYVLQVRREFYDNHRFPVPRHLRSPVFESPLGLFSDPVHRTRFADQLGIELGRMPTVLSPWATKRLEEFEGDISNFEVAKLYPSARDQIALAVTDPGDENNQDVSTLIGCLDMHEVERFHQNDPDAYNFSGGLNRANQGLLEFREMFKAPIKTLNPLLFAPQDHNYAAAEGIAALPFDGLIVAHSNESEWQQFANNKNNEAFIDRVFIVKVPYCLRVSEEVKIYQKLLRDSTLRSAPCAPKTLEVLAQFSVLTRLREHENSTPRSKMFVYDGVNVKNDDPKAKSLQEYRDHAGVNEGMDGMSTRFSFKILSATFNYDPSELAADPIRLLGILERELKHQVHDSKTLEKFTGTFIKQTIVPLYKEFLDDQVRQAFFGAYKEYGQNMFDKYITFAEHWLEDQDYRDPETGTQWDRQRLDMELEAIEKPSEIKNKKGFREEAVRYCLRFRSTHNGLNPEWNTYRRLGLVLEKKMMLSTTELLPVISFDRKSTPEMQKRHDEFVERMIAKGYTHRQVRILVDWYFKMMQAD